LPLAALRAAKIFCPEQFKASESPEGGAIFYSRFFLLPDVRYGSEGNARPKTVKHPEDG
jgi:hypothetical protein